MGKTTAAQRKPRETGSNRNKKGEKGKKHRQIAGMGDQTSQHDTGGKREEKAREKGRQTKRGDRRVTAETNRRKNATNRLKFVTQSINRHLKPKDLLREIITEGPLYIYQRVKELK